MWRSLLFMPVLEERFLAKAAERGADAVVLDLEASIVAARKDEARAALAPAVERLHAAGQDVLVRINMPWRPALKDLEFAVRPASGPLRCPAANRLSTSWRSMPASANWKLSAACRTAASAWCR